MSKIYLVVGIKAYLNELVHGTDVLDVGGVEEDGHRVVGPQHHGRVAGVLCDGRSGVLGHQGDLDLSDRAKTKRNKAKMASENMKRKMI